MSEVIQARRRFQRLQDLLATLVVSGIFAGILALLVEGLIVLFGLALGDTAWHRSWVDQRLAASIDWLCGVPVLGPLVTLLRSPKHWLPANGYLRDLFAFWLASYPLLLIPARRIGPTLIARYDDETLRPWPLGDSGLRWAGPLGDAQSKVWDALHAWCLAGTEPGKSPFWRPWVMPQVGERFSIAVLTGANGVGKSHLAEALCRKLDHSPQIHACTSRLAELHLRLQVKFRECLWWRPCEPADPWDTGYLVEDPAARRRLAHFLPRRSTLIVADELPSESLRDAIEELNARRADFRHPVRLLVIDSALPRSLGLRWEADHGVWNTDVQELGEVLVVDLSGAHFGPPQFRAMVSAQIDTAGQPLQLMGSDKTWLPLIEALDGQPVLLAEAIRLVREGKARLDDLRRIDYIQDQLAVAQNQRVPFRLPPDVYGRARELMRERVLMGRVQHREQVIRAALGADMGGGEEAYFALLVASLAGGASPARLRKMLGWTVDKLGEDRLAQVFATAAGVHWVPPIKPAVVADEMLRRYFHAPHGAALADERRQEVARALRIAWLCNPGGTFRTLSRWAAQRRRDDFVQTLLTSPKLKQLTQSEALPGMSEGETRAEIARAFFELAVFHGGDVAEAEEAMQGLSEAELERYARLVETLLPNPEIRGLPALVLWLKLVIRRWPGLAQSNVAQTRAFGIELLRQAEHLVRQARLRSVWEKPFEPILTDVLNQILPRAAQLSEACGTDVKFRQAAKALDECARFREGVLNRLRSRLRAALAAGLAGSNEAPSGEPGQWTKALMGSCPGTWCKKRQQKRSAGHRISGLAGAHVRLRPQAG